MDRFTRDDFLNLLHDGLCHLHDADALRRSPLAALFGVANRLDTSSALRNILISAIGALKPAGDGPAPAHAWEMHDALFCCHVQQLSQRVVADQLAMSPRQLRREQRAALEVLADRLCDRFHLVASTGEGEEPDAHPVTASVTAGDDLAWLKDLPLDKPAALDETLFAVQALIQPLAAQHRVRLAMQIADGLPNLAVHQVALSQILLGLLAVAIPQARGNEVRLCARSTGWVVHVEVQCPRSPALSWAVSGDDTASLDMARQLAELCGGRLSISEGDGASLSIGLILPALKCLPVLVIDDNADALQLYQRYTTGTRYRITGAREPEQALGLVENLMPEVIVLDVMMPQVDGWKVLGRLRQHPRTGHIPIIVCTILPQEALSLSLGASAFVRKPVTRQALLAALDEQVARMAREPH